ncbi:unnamed protein product [Amoebophrya sp. A120]|nr:unnamed protein product [Amoebophrya sp. A120]|eukprot:GSA120T00008063001.1
MVAFGEQLVRDRVIEWRAYYVSYEVLKDYISEMVRDLSYHERFLQELGNNILRFTRFYEHQEARLLDSVAKWARVLERSGGAPAGGRTPQTSALVGNNVLAKEQGERKLRDRDHDGATRETGIPHLAATSTSTNVNVVPVVSANHEPVQDQEHDHSEKRPHSSSTTRGTGAPPGVADADYLYLSSNEDPHHHTGGYNNFETLRSSGTTTHDDGTTTLLGRSSSERRRGADEFGALGSALTVTSSVMLPPRGSNVSVEEGVFAAENNQNKRPSTSHELSRARSGSVVLANYYHDEVRNNNGNDTNFSMSYSTSVGAGSFSSSKVKAATNGFFRFSPKDLEAARRAGHELGAKIDRLIKFAETNCTAVRKILKKFDKEIARREHLKVLAVRRQAQTEQVAITNVGGRAGSSAAGTQEVEHLSIADMGSSSQLAAVPAIQGVENPTGSVVGALSIMPTDSSESGFDRDLFEDSKHDGDNIINDKKEKQLKTSKSKLVSLQKDVLDALSKTAIGCAKQRLFPLKELVQSVPSAARLFLNNGAGEYNIRNNPNHRKTGMRTPTEIGKGAAKKVFDKLKDRFTTTSKRPSFPRPSNQIEDATGAGEGPRAPLVPNDSLGNLSSNGLLLNNFYAEAGAAGEKILSKNDANVLPRKRNSNPGTESPASDRAGAAEIPPLLERASTMDLAAIATTLEQADVDQGPQPHGGGPAGGVPQLTLLAQKTTSLMTSLRLSTQTITVPGGSTTVPGTPTVGQPGYHQGSSTMMSKLVNNNSSSNNNGVNNLLQTIPPDATTSTTSKKPKVGTTGAQIAKLLEKWHWRPPTRDPRSQFAVNDQILPDFQIADMPDEDEVDQQILPQGSTDFTDALEGVELYNQQEIMTRRRARAGEVLLYQESVLTDEEYGAGDQIEFLSTSSCTYFLSSTVQDLFLNVILSIDVLFPIMAAILCFVGWQNDLCKLFVEDADFVAIPGEEPLDPEDKNLPIPSWKPWLTIWTTAVVLRLLVTGWPSDGTLIFATLWLCLVGVLDLEQAWAGFSNNVVLSVAVLGVVAQGVEQTGSVERIFSTVLGNPKGKFKEATLRLLLPAIVLNVGMSNTAVMSILTPILEKWSQQIGISKNMFLMPLSYVLLISGTVAIFATSSNLIAQGLMIEHNQKPFGTFEIAPVALCSTAVTLLAVLLLMEKLFPDLAEVECDDDAGTSSFAVEDDDAATQMLTPSDYLKTPAGDHLMAAAEQQEEARRVGVVAATAGPQLQQPLLDNSMAAGVDAFFKSSGTATKGDTTTSNKRDETASISKPAAKQVEKHSTASHGGAAAAPPPPPRERKDTKRFLLSVQMSSPEYLGKTLAECDFLKSVNEVIQVERLGQKVNFSNTTTGASSSALNTGQLQQHTAGAGGVSTAGTVGVSPTTETTQQQSSFTFQYYDIVHMYTSAAQVVAIHRNAGLHVLCRDVGDPVVHRLADSMEIAEIVLDAACPLLQQPMCSDQVRRNYGAKVLAVRPLYLTESLRGALFGPTPDKTKIAKAVQEFAAMELKGRKFQLGDTLLVLAREGFAERHVGSSEFFGVRALYQPSLDGGIESSTSLEKKAKKEQKRKSTSAGRTSQVKNLVHAGGGRVDESKNVEQGSYNKVKLKGDLLAEDKLDERNENQAHDPTSDAGALEVKHSASSLENLQQLEQAGEDFSVSTSKQPSLLARIRTFFDDERQQKQAASLLILAVMILSVSTDTIPLLSASMAAAYALVATKCLSKDQAIAAVKLRTVLTIVGAFGLGDAIGRTKVALLVASGVTTALSPFGETGLLIGIYLVTVLLGIVFHATAVVILIFPVCLDAAQSLGVSVHRAVTILMIGAGCQMLSPVSYQTNLMAFAAGGYSFNDFPRLGLPIVLLIGIVAVPATQVFIE